MRDLMRDCLQAGQMCMTLALLLLLAVSVRAAKDPAPAGVITGTGHTVGFGELKVSGGWFRGMDHLNTDGKWELATVGLGPRTGRDEMGGV